MSNNINQFALRASALNFGIQSQVALGKVVPLPEVITTEKEAAIIGSIADTSGKLSIAEFAKAVGGDIAYTLDGVGYCIHVKF